MPISNCIWHVSTNDGACDEPSLAACIVFTFDSKKSAKVDAVQARRLSCGMGISAEDGVDGAPQLLGKFGPLAVSIVFHQ